MLPGISALSLPKAYILAGLLSCVPQAAPNVRIDLQDNPVQIDNTRSSGDLATLSTERGSSSFHDAEFPIVGGLTSFSLQGTPHMIMEISPQPDGACIWIKNIGITLAYAPVIYIASNYKPGSCRYAQAEEHEQKHANVNIITLREFLPTLKPALESALAQGAATASAEEVQISAGKEALNKRVADVLQKWLESMLQVRTPRQQQIDSPEESRRFSKACPNDPVR